MAESLKDHLIKAGLSPAGKKKPVSGAGDIDLVRAYRLRKSETQRQRQDARAQKLTDEKHRREINNKIRAVVDQHAVRDPNADIARNFMFKGRIRRVLVNRDQLAAVNAGKLVIVYLAGSYHLVPVEAASMVQKIALPDLGSENNYEDEEFPVPDDLLW